MLRERLSPYFTSGPEIIKDINHLTKDALEWAKTYRKRAGFGALALLVAGVGVYEAITKPQKGAIETWATEEGQEMKVPKIIGLTPQVVKMRGKDAVVYFTDRKNPFGLKGNAPVAIFDPDIYPVIPPGVNPKDLKKIGGVALTPRIASYLRLSKQSPEGRAFIATFDIKGNIDNLPKAETNPTEDQIIDIKASQEPIISAGIEIYGGLIPITEEQLPELIERINSEQYPKEENTHHVTVFATDDAYDLFPYDNNGKSMESHLREQAIAVNERFSKEGKPNKVDIQRIIILRAKPDNLSEPIRDSDSIEVWADRYMPHKKNYDYTTGIDQDFMNRYSK